MVRYRNEFGEVRHKRRQLISDSVLRDLEALKIYPDEPVDSVIKRLLQSMNPKEVTESIFAKLDEINAKMRAGWNTQIRKKYNMVHRKRLSNKEWVQKLYEQALNESE